MNAREDRESEMNQRRAIQDTHPERVKLQRRPAGAPVKRFHEPGFACQRNGLQTPRSLGDGSQTPLSKIGLDGEQSCVRLLKTEFEEVA